MFSLYFDGCSIGNPGPSGSGAIIYDSFNNVVWEVSKFLNKIGTNNEAEYYGLLLGLQQAILFNIENLQVYGDSMLVIKQMKGEYKISAKNLLPYHSQCKTLESKFKYINYKHIYRSDNKKADLLANLAIKLSNVNDLSNTNAKSNTISWEDKLKEWENGIPVLYPKNIKKRFFYETSVLKNGNCKYEEKYIETTDNFYKKESYLPYIEYIYLKNNNYAISFYNLDKTTKLIIPIPKKGKDFTTMKDFIDNASFKQQKEFWKKVAYEIREMLLLYPKIYVNIHGLGISYFHLRLDIYPKYYKTKEFI